MRKLAAYKSLRKRIKHWRSGQTARRRFLELAKQHSPYVAIEAHGFVVVVPTHDRVTPGFFVRRTRNEITRLNLAVERLEQAGVHVARTTFVEGGAHVGTATLTALGAGFSRVLACEPLPDNARLLRTNVALNGAHDSVRVLELALSDQAGTVRLAVGQKSGGTSRVVSDSAETSRGGVLAVRSARLDDLVAEGGADGADVGFIWLDTEGHEWHVLSGAANLLARYAPPLVIELNPRLLRKAGTLEALPALLQRYYTHVSDLSDATGGFVPTATIGDLVSRYSDGAKQGSTDLLLFRQFGNPGDG